MPVYDGEGCGCGNRGRNRMWCGDKAKGKPFGDAFGSCRRYDGGFCRKNYGRRGIGGGNDLPFRAGGTFGGIYCGNCRDLCGAFGIGEDEGGYFGNPFCLYCIGGNGRAGFWTSDFCIYGMAWFNYQLGNHSGAVFYGNCCIRPDGYYPNASYQFCSVRHYLRFGWNCGRSCNRGMLCQHDWVCGGFL